MSAPARPTDAASGASPAAQRAFLFDVFLVFDVATPATLDRVNAISNALKRKNASTAVTLAGPVTEAEARMFKVIEQSAIAVVFVSSGLVQKVDSDDDDNCKSAFDHCVRRLGPKKMIPAVLEAKMQNVATWAGPVGAILGKSQSIDATEAADKVTDKIMEEVLKRDPAGAHFQQMVWL